MEKNENNVSRIIGIQFSLLSPDEIRRGSVAEIVSRDTYVNNKPVIGGLFDPRMGVLEPGMLCPTDGLNYMDCPGYFGHIELASPVFYIQYLTTIIKILRMVCIKCSKLLISRKKYKSFLELDNRNRFLELFTIANKIKRCGEDTEEGCGCKQPKKIQKEGFANIIATWDNIEETEEGTSENMTLKLTPTMVLKIFKRISDDDVGFMGFSPTFSRPEWMVCEVLAVPPPAMRPSVKHDAQQRSEDDISHIIVSIIKSNITLKEKILQDALPKVIDDWQTLLQYYCATMVDNKIPGAAPVTQRSGRPLRSVKERIVGKGGRLRGNLMGKRVDFSGRSVITPDPNINIGELGVPVAIAKNITYPETVNSRNKQFLTKLMVTDHNEYPGAKILERKSGESISLQYTDKDSLELHEGDILHRHLIDGDPVLFNRQPTLHKMSMMCHRVKVLKQGATFRLNVAVTKPYNADFDGDEMNIHVPQDDESSIELLLLAAVPRQIISPADNTPIIGMFQDSLLGAFRMTRPNITFDTRTSMNLLMNIADVNVDLFKNKNKKISSFEILSQLLPKMSCRFKNGQSDEEDKNNTIEIIKGVLMRGQLDKRAFGAGSKGLIHSIFNHYGHESAEKFINNMQHVINEYMKISSYSVGISDLISNNETNKAISETLFDKKEAVQNLINNIHTGTFENKTGKTNEIEFETQVNNLLEGAVSVAGKLSRTNLPKDNKFVTMVASGSKGKNLNIAQMVACLGQQNVDGKRIPYGYDKRTLPHYTKFDDSPEARGFVESSFIQGLSPEELYFHAQAGREGLIDTAVKTSQTGYIQRRLIKGLEDLIFAYDGTVRNGKGKIIQFKYGDDNVDTAKIEHQSLPLTEMNLEEIYSHFQIDLDDTNGMFINYTTPANKRFKNQLDTLKEYTKELIKYTIEKREELLKYVFKNSNNTIINIPVNFKRIINYLSSELNLNINSMVNITPLELFKIIDSALDDMDNIHFAQPTELFKLAFRFFLTPKNLLLINKFNRKGIELLIAKIKSEYMNSLCNPGEMVGMIAAQSIGEPTTQLTLNTFHFAGVASKSNVTRGVPRIEEILSISENPKQPSTTIYLKGNENTNIEKAQELKYSLEYTCLNDITQSVSICFDPDNMKTLIKEDVVLIREYNKYIEMTSGEEGFLNKKTDENGSRWIIRFELDRNAMLDKNINMDDVHYAIEQSYDKNVTCVYSDFNSDKLIMRVRLDKSLTHSKQQSLDQSDEIYKLKNLQKNMLNNIVLRGVKRIPKIIIRKLVNQININAGDIEKEDIWVLDTVGTNLKDIINVPGIDPVNTTSNDIQEVYRTLGIEAARQCIYNELEEAFDDSSYINSHHFSVLCDRMTATSKMVSIFRHGINNDDIGPIAKASFEETPEMFLRAARHAELDPMKGISANVMCGQEGYFGTGYFQVLLDINKMSQLSSKKLDDEVDMSKLFGIDNETGVCAIDNIALTSDTGHIKGSNTGSVPDEYDIGF